MFSKDGVTYPPLEKRQIHDGSPLKAATSSTAQPSQDIGEAMLPGYHRVQDVKAVDDATDQIKRETQRAVLPACPAYSPAKPSQKNTKAKAPMANGDYGKSGCRPRCGSGPYMVKEFRLSISATCRNSDWWAIQPKAPNEVRSSGTTRSCDRPQLDGEQRAGDYRQCSPWKAYDALQR